MKSHAEISTKNRLDPEALPNEQSDLVQLISKLSQIRSCSGVTDAARRITISGTFINSLYADFIETKTGIKLFLILNTATDSNAAYTFNTAPYHGFPLDGHLVDLLNPQERVPLNRGYFSIRVPARTARVFKFD
jgi:hypothetical protein